MMRCKPHQEYNDTLLRQKIACFYSSNINRKKIDDASLDFLKNVAVNAIKATGDKLYKSKRNAKLFIPASTKVEATIELLLKEQLHPTHLK